MSSKKSAILRYQKQLRRKEQADEARDDRKHQDRAGGFGEIIDARSRSSGVLRLTSRCSDSNVERAKQQRSHSCRCSAARSRTKISRVPSISFATRRRKARRSFVCRSCFARNIFARRKTTTISHWLKKYPEDRHRALEKLARETRRRHHRVAFRETRRRRLSQHRRDHRRRWQTSREISQDAHPGRSALSREVLFHAGRSRISRRGQPRTGKSASAFAGTNGIRKRRA